MLTDNPGAMTSGFSDFLAAIFVVVFGFLFVTVASRISGLIGNSSNPISGMTIATLMATCAVFLVIHWTSTAHQVLALTIGGCFCNDLRYVAHAIGVELGTISISVAVELEGDPILATAATMMVDCKMLDGSTARTIIEKANEVCMAINSLGRGIPVQVRTAS